jgi:hypothetical protein
VVLQQVYTVFLEKWNIGMKVRLAVVQSSQNASNESVMTCRQLETSMKHVKILCGVQRTALVDVIDLDSEKMKDVASLLAGIHR